MSIIMRRALACNVRTCLYAMCVVPVVSKEYLLLYLHVCAEREAEDRNQPAHSHTHRQTLVHVHVYVQVHICVMC